MAHIKIGDNSVVDWITGDPEGDRAYLFTAYRAFLKEILLCKNQKQVKSTFTKWNISELDIDAFPRINIAFPVDYKEKI